MTHGIRDLKPVYVVGVGMHPYVFPGDTPYIEMGLSALRGALSDAGVPFPAIQSAYVGTTGIGMAAGRIMFNHIGSTGLAVTQVENASASGSSAFRLACMEIASGLSDCVLAIGVDKHGDQVRAINKEGIGRLSDTATIPLMEFALMADLYAQEKGLTAEDQARVASKNHTNASQNPFAQFRKPRSVEDVLTSRPVAGMTTSLMCTPRGDGAAAAILCSEEGIRTLGIAGTKPIRILSSVLESETPRSGGRLPTTIVAETVAQKAYSQAGITASDLDVVELHEAFAIEELLYTESFGLVPEGQGHHFVRDGGSAIGGRCAVNPSGGLIGQGHPLGPTGIGQIHEIVRQLRGEQGLRQQPGARTGMAHMIGLGTIAIAHILQRD